MSHFSVSTLACVAGLLVAVYKFIVHPCFLSPLASIPNAHFTAAFSPLWILWARYMEQVNSAIHQAHEKYGPIVRLGPNEVSVNCVEGGIKAIYTGGWEKHPWYERIFTNYGAPNMFSTVHNRPHSQRKRLLTHIYSKSHIHGSPHMVAIARTLLYERLLPLLRPSSSGQLPSQPKTLDVYALFGAAAMDFITAYVFGLRCSTNHLGDKLQNECWIEWYTGREPGRFWSAELPLLKHFFDSVLRLQLTPPRVMQVSNNIDAYCMRLCDQAEALLYSHREKSALKDGEEPFVYAKLRNALGDNEMRPGRLTPDMSVQLEVASEMTDHMAAGFDTSSITLTYFAWELSRHSKAQERLREELLSLTNPIVSSATPASADTTPLPSFHALDALPYLQAVLLETLRFHAAIPGSEPRVSPGGPDAMLVGGHEIPAGTRASAQAWSLHRNPDAFPRPEEWLPERWIDGEAAQAGLLGSEKKERWFWAFGSGGRMCIGSNFAMLDMKLIIAAIWTSYETHIVDDEGIAQIDAYTAAPSGRRLILRFEPVEPSKA